MLGFLTKILSERSSSESSDSSTSTYFDSDQESNVDIPKMDVPKTDKPNIVTPPEGTEVKDSIAGLKFRRIYLRAAFTKACNKLKAPWTGRMIVSGILELLQSSKNDFKI